jgi:hypothetical protein
MKNKILNIKILFLEALILIFLAGCSGYKDMVERRNLMMPKQSELPRNRKFREAKKKKTYAKRAKRAGKRKHHRRHR